MRARIEAGRQLSGSNTIPPRRFALGVSIDPGVLPGYTEKKLASRASRRAWSLEQLPRCFLLVCGASQSSVRSVLVSFPNRGLKAASAAGPPDRGTLSQCLGSSQVRLSSLTIERQAGKPDLHMPSLAIRLPIETMGNREADRVLPKAWR